jgi:hypothetical protein
MSWLARWWNRSWQRYTDNVNGTSGVQSAMIHNEEIQAYIMKILAEHDDRISALERHAGGLTGVHSTDFPPNWRKPGNDTDG